MRLLIVKGHELMRVTLAEWLGQEFPGSNIAVAPSTETAVNFLAHHPVQAVIMDIQLPGLAGIDSISRIAAGPPEIRMIVMTILDADACGPRVLEAGAAVCFSKSAAVDRLMPICGFFIRKRLLRAIGSTGIQLLNRHDEQQGIRDAKS